MIWYGVKTDLLGQSELICYKGDVCPADRQMNKEPVSTLECELKWFDSFINAIVHWGGKLNEGKAPVENRTVESEQ
jgi:hypothetical protein